MRTRLVAGFCLAILTLAVLSARQPAPVPPTILALVVEVQRTGVRVLSAQAVKGVIREPRPAELANVPRGPADMVVEYTLKLTAAGARPLATGIFHVSFEAISERTPDPVHALPTADPYRVRQRVVAIKVPDVRAASIAFAMLTPAAGVPPDQWVRTPIGEVAIPPVRR
jgi:hypothetical protein